MTAQEFRTLRHAMDLSQAQLGKLMGVSTNTIARWEADDGPRKREVAPTAARLLWVLRWRCLNGEGAQKMMHFYPSHY